tara:strand:- start:267 stop:1343 length:1077 start_codon:yes stop_codon:yes gene_type:complete
MKDKQTKKNNTLPRCKKNNKTKKRVGIKEIIVKAKHNENKISSKEGNFFDTKHYDKIIKEDCDVYGIDETGKKKLLLKLRKGVIPDAVCQNAFTSLEKEAQHLNSNRGAAAGKVNLKKLPKYVGDIVKRDNYRVYYKSPNGELRKDNISNLVRSNIIGFYDMPDRNKLAVYKKMGKEAPKCRQTAFTRDKVEEWKNAIPIIEAGDKQFKELLPNRHKNQYLVASQTPDFQVKDTAYSTVTINYNYRSACHKDAGDFEEGFGNLMVLEKDKCCHNNIKKTNTKDVYSYEGGYLGFPKYGICVDVRQGDYLAMDVHEWHCNCKMICGCPRKEKCKNKDHYGRLSLVCYLRKGMIKCQHIN